MDNKIVSIIDLTHPIADKIPTWDGVPGFELVVEKNYKDFTPPDMFRTQKIICNAGIGTHIDAPSHMIMSGRTVEQLTLAELFADCIVFDLSSETTEDYMIKPDVLDRYEKTHGEIPSASFVLFYTGWDKYWDTPDMYRNNYKFPSLSPATAEALIFRGVAGVGIDTLSVDTGEHGFEAHRVLLGNDRYIIENVANSKLLPYTGAKILALPMHIEGATEAPVRLVALM